jgi:hypothetical protein
VSAPNGGHEALRRLSELQAALEAGEIDSNALEIASARVAAALAALSRTTPPAELARLVDLHACVRDTTARRRAETGDALDRARADRERLARLTRPSDDAGALDVEA